MNETALCNLYELTAGKPGWLSKLQNVFGLDEMEVGFLSWLDSQEHAMKKRVEAFEKQMRREGYDEAFEGAENDEEKLEKITKIIFTFADQYDEMRRKDMPYVERMLFLIVNRFDYWRKIRNQIRGRMIQIKYPSSMAITEEDIIKAREVPLETLVELDKTKHMLCPFHDDKNPSMWVRDGYGWCFACGAWCDAIRYLTDVRKMSFVDAVKRLVNK